IKSLSEKEGQEKNMKTAIYVRASTKKQACHSISMQIEELKKHIKIKGCDFYKVYADEGISGKNITDRPAINELIQDIETGKVNNVLVYSIDRLTRNLKDLKKLAKIFKEHDCFLNSVMDKIDTETVYGKKFLDIIGILAEYERKRPRYMPQEGQEI
ncbi:MAG: recombinase family protein, partial [Defluviitaleaceae bacterium]|nr:recombinase family protein [Defluviitaleaceae bacterium]